MKSKTVVITHPKVISFIENNEQLDINDILGSCIEIFEHAMGYAKYNSANYDSKDDRLLEYFENFKKQNLLQNEIKYREIIDTIKDSMKSDDSSNIVSRLETKIYALNQQSETRLNQQLININNDLKESKMNNNSVNTVLQETKEVLQKLMSKKVNSSDKGGIGEHKLMEILQKNLPSTDVIHTGGKSKSGDIILKLEGKPDILIDTKEYSTNVNKEEINKFVRDTSINNCSGILMSQKTGICNKNNFEINIVDNNILLYLHSVDYNFDLMKIAINIIYHLFEKIKENQTDCIEIDVDTLKSINIEVNTFIRTQSLIIKRLKDQYKENIELVSGLKLDNLSTLLSSYFSVNNVVKNKCSICNKVFNNQNSLNSHSKLHKNN
jgi:hypothetical protein